MINNNNLTVITKENKIFGDVRFTIINGKEYAVGNDIAKSLGYASPKNAVSTHCKGGIETVLPTKGGNQTMKVIPEGDIYRLITKSKLPNAEKFESWVFDEVLPSIRKHGAYMNEETLEKALTSPDFLIQLATKLKEEQEARRLAEKEKEILQEVIEEQKPLVVIADKFTNSSNSYDLGTFSKILELENMGKTRLFKYLRDIGLLMKGNIPYQKYTQYFKVIMCPKCNGQKYPKTLIKANGIIYVIKKLMEDGYVITKPVSEILEEIESQAEVIRE